MLLVAGGIASVSAPDAEDTHLPAGAQHACNHVIVYTSHTCIALHPQRPPVNICASLLTKRRACGHA